MSRKPGKKDFDLDRMYQKLIPSLQAEGLSFSELSPPPQEEEPEDDGIVKPVNLMEQILREKMEHALKVLRACDCERCRSDILAAALNQLPSVYAVDSSRFEEKVLETRRRYEVKATGALILAVQTVKANPRH